MDPLPATAILVIGDVMVDRYIFGQVDRISPEAPVPVLAQKGGRIAAGGAANVAANIVALGGDVELIGLVGADQAADELRQVLCDRGVSRLSMLADPARPTVCKTRVMSGRQQIVRIDEEVVLPPSEDVSRRILEVAHAAMRRCKLVVLSDYAKGILSDPLLAELIATAKSLDCRVMVDPKRRSFDGYRGADLIKPNRAELAGVAGHPCDTDRDVEAAGNKVSEQLAGAAVLVTRAEAGMSLMRRGRPAMHVPTMVQEVADVSGAGDTALAALSVALAEGMQLDDAVEMANFAAGIAVSKAGTAIVTRAEVEAARSRAAAQTLHAGRLVDHDTARHVMAGWRSLGETVVFTNGCFDLLHSGHIRLLTNAAKEGDRLVVALNADASVKRLKGPSRPIQNELNRAEIIGALRMVDLVVLFSEDTPMELIVKLEPDVIVKGADYKEDQVVGGDVVKARGGRVVVVPLVEGQSTTSLIKRGGR
jgi:D-beta-D-heptose 7-phosphate kinase / D-beta-D-heptose 1-phosphate adenosyltransferase